MELFESGHGKGILDSSGGALKRSADLQIKYGKNIMTAQQFVNNMRKSETKCILITEKKYNRRTKTTRRCGTESSPRHHETSSNDAQK